MGTGTGWFAAAACAAWAEVLVAAVLLRVRGGSSGAAPDGAPPGPEALALLRGGPRAAVTVALVALHQRGAVAAGRKHTVRANGGPGRTRDPVQLGVHRSLRNALPPRTLALRPEARRAVDGLRAEMGRAGLLRPPGRRRAARLLLAAAPATLAAGLLIARTGERAGPGPVLLLAAGVPVLLAVVALLRLPPATRAARRHLAELRERHPLPAHRREVTDGRLVQLYVALYGDPALAMFLPRFARDGGLLGHRAPDGR
ncbi:TIGR04222 domain-containing membrane protein [Streptomyces sp. R302]|uniref:TIGR04222 domain-containing membrane protein n=1 Tax=unclassified Streptomyces TaxID=2593676 RepID=UPI00145D81AA|nr:MULTISPECIES: TIGR04222 domain-containing membrane protein [unclassified Streptomyces]NML51283.1 TIGR04222 domain-containing membrane protein [Streptomyces sp. R301]NML79861.1 TIGR04222 domain-containing membrane protein [Streptomyces sp. R302]